MRLAVELASRNVEHRTGGPFGAAIFEIDTWRIVGLGVNLVEPSNCSILHAEMVAIAMAQQTVGSYDLAAGGGVRHELATSTEPCAMCLGAIPGRAFGACSAEPEERTRAKSDLTKGPNPRTGWAN
jgi:tRNA(Arg) A34 adenosine deaminase TadA